MLRLTTLIVLVLVFFSAETVSAALYQPTVVLSDSEVVPSVLMPGDTGMITVTLTNTAKSSTSTSTDSIVTTKMEINPTITGVFLDGGKDIRVTGGNSGFTGDLGPQQSVSLTFAVEAPEEDGIYYAVLRVGVKDSKNLEYPIPVNVNMPVSGLKKPVLILSQSGDASFEPGEGAELLIGVFNSGRSIAEDIFIRISEDDPSFAPESSGSYHIPSLSSGEYASFNISFISDTDMETGVHEIPVVMTYSVVDGTTGTQTDAITVDVRGTGDMSIASLKTDPVRVSEKDRFDLTIRIENTGTGDAKSTTAKIDLPFSGTREAYIGKIKPGNDAPAVFTLDAGDAGDYEYSMAVTYEDDTGTHESVYHLTQHVGGGGDGGGFVVALVIIAGLAAGGYYFFVYRKKEEEEV